MTCKNKILLKRNVYCINFPTYKKFCALLKRYYSNLELHFHEVGGLRRHRLKKSKFFKTDEINTGSYNSHNVTLLCFDRTVKKDRKISSLQLLISILYLLPILGFSWFAVLPGL